RLPGAGPQWRHHRAARQESGGWVSRFPVVLSGRLVLVGWLIVLVLVGRLIVLAADQRGDLVPDAELRAADQLPGPADPAQEADDHQDRDRVHRVGVVRMG